MTANKKQKTKLPTQSFNYYTILMITISVFWFLEERNNKLHNSGAEEQTGIFCFLNTITFESLAFSEHSTKHLSCAEIKSTKVYHVSYLSGQLWLAANFFPVWTVNKMLHMYIWDRRKVDLVLLLLCEPIHR